MSFSQHTSFRNPAHIQSESENDYSGEHRESAHSSSSSTHHSSSPTSKEYPEGTLINQPTFPQPLTSVPTIPDLTVPPTTRETLANILFPDSKLHSENTITLSQKKDIVPEPTPVIAFRSEPISSTLDIPHDPLIKPFPNPIPPTNTTAASTSLSNIIPLQPTSVFRTNNPSTSTFTRPYTTNLPQPQAAIMATPEAKE